MNLSRIIPLLLCLSALPLHAADIKGYVFVNDDASLRIRGKTVHLYGIYVPPTDESCRSFQRPVACAPRAALALEFNIGSHFVGCDIQGENADGSLIGLCRVEDQDLSAQLLQQGWAVARPEAPIEYHTLEKLARNRGVGIWGVPIDRERPW
jgi:endonuclease YncB( thermonuclease family)